LCALFALAIQFTLSFGHAHRLQIAEPFGALASSALAAHAVSTAKPDAPAVPRDPAGVAFDFCAICAVANLAASALPGAAPSLPLMAVAYRTRFWPDADVVSAASPHRSFRARAPPVV